MKLEDKNKKNKKVNNYMKKNNMFFIFFKNHSDIDSWRNIKKNLKIFEFETTSSLKNNSIKNLFKNSIYSKFKILSSHNLILFFFRSPLLDFFIKTNIEFLSLKLLALKLNNKIYHKNQLINSYSLSYVCTKFLLFQFKIFHLKKNSK